MVRSMFYVLMNRYCTVIVLFPQPNALCVKSQDVYVIRSLTRGIRQREKMEQSQEMRVHVMKDRSKKRWNHKRGINMRKRRTWTRWSGVIKASASDILAVLWSVWNQNWVCTWVSSSGETGQHHHPIRYHFISKEWGLFSAHDQFRRLRSTLLICGCFRLFALLWIHNLLTKAYICCKIGLCSTKK